MNSPSLTESGLAGGVAIVTGGSRGIGRAIVQTLAAAGMNVAFTYLQNASAANEVLTAGSPGQVSAESIDVRDATACAGCVDNGIDRAGRLDLHVNNAGVIQDNPLTALEDDDMQTVLDTNVTGTFNMTRAAAPFMVSQRRGRIINISSASGDKGKRGQTNYAASKG